MKNFEKGTGPAQTMENLNWLVGQSRMLGDRLTQAEQAVQQLQGALESNNEILQKFLDENDMVQQWQMYIEQVQKDMEEQNAVQESETEGLDVQEQAEDSEEVGKGDA